MRFPGAFVLFWGGVPGPRTPFIASGWRAPVVRLVRLTRQVHCGTCIFELRRFRLPPEPFPLGCDIPYLSAFPMGCTTILRSAIRSSDNTIRCRGARLVRTGGDLGHFHSGKLPSPYLLPGKRIPFFQQREAQTAPSERHKTSIALGAHSLFLKKQKKSFPSFLLSCPTDRQPEGLELDSTTSWRDW